MPRNLLHSAVLPALAVALVFSGLLALGFWQLDRAGEKKALQAAMSSRAQMPVLELDGTGLDADRHEFRRASASGHYDPRWQIFLDNQVRRGRVGVDVLTPLRLPDGSWLLVNRGWVPWPDRSALPTVVTPRTRVSVDGRLRAPSGGYFTLEPDMTAFQALWQNLDLDRYAALTGLAIQPMLLELDPAVEGAGGFLREWSVVKDDWIARHHGYAFQWFALAATLALLYVLLSLRRKTNRE